MFLTVIVSIDQSEFMCSTSKRVMNTRLLVISGDAPLKALGDAVFLFDGSALCS